MILIDEAMSNKKQNHLSDKYNNYKMKFGITYDGGQSKEPYLQILLDDEEEIDDTLLNYVDHLAHNLCFKRERGISPLKYPLKITCSPEALGALKPKKLLLYGVVSFLDDAIFEHCSQLELLHIGASNAPLFSTPPTNLMKCPLKFLNLNGYGLVLEGESMPILEQHIKSIGGQVCRYY